MAMITVNWTKTKRKNENYRVKRIGFLAIVNFCNFVGHIMSQPFWQFSVIGLSITANNKIGTFMKHTIITALFITLAFSTLKAQVSLSDVISLSTGTLTIHPVQHASLVLSENGKTIYVDPVGGAGLYKGFEAPDMILITDIHADHMDPKTLDSIKKEGTLFIVPQAVADKLPPQDKVKMVILKNGDQTQQLGIGISALPMYNLPESPDAFHTKGRGNGYILHISNKNLYISGDTEDIPEMRSLKNIDIAFVCMNLPYTMDINHAASAVLAFKPKIIYPYHYRGQNGLSDVNAFKQMVDAGKQPIEVRLRNWYATQ